MKNVALISLIGCILFVTSCGNDDSGTPALGLSGDITFNGNTSSIQNGFLLTVSNDDLSSSVFYLADGTLTLNTETGSVSSTDSEIIISVSAIAASGTLENGTYETNDLNADQVAFVTVSTVDGTDVVTSQSITGGTVNIQGSGASYTLTFDVPFGRDVTLTGVVSGTYEVPAI